MSVLQCDRGDCQNVMCDRFSSKLQAYICNDCYAELVRLGPSTDLVDFMDKPKEVYESPHANEAYFNAIFPFTIYS